MECAVCLQPSIHPVKLPCNHIFCFLCVKGVTIQSQRCPMCRREIPTSFLEHPTLVINETLEPEEDNDEEEEVVDILSKSKNVKYVSFAFFTVYGFAISYYTSDTDLMLMVCFISNKTHLFNDPFPKS